MKLRGASKVTFKPGPSRLEQAIQLALMAHAGQKRKNGEPYILHPLRVMQAIAPYGSETMMIAAVLHDVCEDCGVTLEAIREQFDSEVAGLVDRLSRREGETYAEFVARAGGDDVSRRIKVADVADNLSRIDEVPDESERKSLRRRYEWAISVLA